MPPFLRARRRVPHSKRAAAVPLHPAEWAAERKGTECRVESCQPVTLPDDVRRQQAHPLLLQLPGIVASRRADGDAFARPFDCDPSQLIARFGASRNVREQILAARVVADLGENMRKILLACETKKSAARRFSQIGDGV